MKIQFLFLYLFVAAFPSAIFAKEDAKIQSGLLHFNEEYSEKEKIFYCQFLMIELCRNIYASYEYQELKDPSWDLFSLLPQLLRAEKLALHAGYPIEDFTEDFHEFIELGISKFEEIENSKDPSCFQIIKFAPVIPPSKIERYKKMASRLLTDENDRKIVNNILQKSSICERFQEVPFIYRNEEYQLMLPDSDPIVAYQALQFAHKMFFDRMISRSKEQMRADIAEEFRGHAIPILSECARYLFEHDEKLALSTYNIFLAGAWMQTNYRSPTMRSFIHQDPILKKWDEEYMKILNINILDKNEKKPQDKNESETIDNISK